MSDRMRLTGMYSGMDTETIVQQLVSVKKTKVDNLKNEQKKLEWKQTAWQDLNSKIYSLYSKTLSNLRLTGSYSKKTTKSSDTTKATVVAGDGAVNGTQTLKVNKLAKSGYLTGAKLDKKEVTADNGTVTKENWTSKDKLSDLKGSLVGNTVSISVGAGTDAKTTDIEITSDMTISQFTAKLREAGVNASFDETNQRFFISSKSTGAANEFALSAKSADGSPSTALYDLGIEAGAAYKDTECVKKPAQDAEIVLNGATFQSCSNAFSVNGLTINVTGVTGTDEEISIVTTTDYDGIYDTIKDFISEYNELINEMDKLYNADSARKYSMLSDDEKEAMSDEEVEKWEGTIKGALLRKDGTLSTVMNSLTQIMMGGYLDTAELSSSQKATMTDEELQTWNKKHTKYLFDYGINTLSYFSAADNEHHAYHIDGNIDDEVTGTNEDKLKKAIAADPEGTAEFFANVCRKMYDSLDKLMASSDYSSIYKVYNDKQLKKEYDDYTTRIKEAEEKLSDYEDKWYDKFSAMETAMAKLQSNTNAVTSMLGSS